MSTTYIRVYDLTRATHLSGRLINKLVINEIISADAYVQHGTRLTPLFKKARYNDLVCTLMIYKEQRGMTRAKAEAKLAGDSYAKSGDSTKPV